MEEREHVVAGDVRVNGLSHCKNAVVSYSDDPWKP